MFSSRSVLSFQVILCIVLLSIQLGILYAITFSNKHVVKVLYVARDEILSLEQKRIEDKNCTNREIFFGQPEHAMNTIIHLAESYVDDFHKVVFSNEAVTGNDVQSISQDIHKQLIQRLQQ